MSRSLSPRVKKLILLAALIPTLIVYLFGATLLADFVPDFWFAKLVYFVVAGILWAFPMKRLMLWANSDERTSV